MIAPDTAYFVFASLLLLSVITIGLCRRDKHLPATYAEFLFTGKTFFHSVASSAGAVFSVTYLLGATFIYATIYRGWTLLMAGAVVATAFFLIRRIIHYAARELPPDPTLFKRHNLLLLFMKQRLPKQNFSIFVHLLALAFFLLLVEELAISRVVISSVMLGLEPLSAVVLFIIIAVIFAYLYLGGFRAVLNSDLAQGAVLAAFLGVLAYYTGDQGESLMVLARPSDLGPLDLAGATFLWTIYGSAFLVMAVDLFSRLNFVAPAHLRTTMHVRFVGVSLLLVLIIAVSGIAFGLAVASEIGALQSASAYYSTVVAFFSSADASAVRVVFLVSVFCMIFTTVDTLLLTVMQIRFYGRGLGSRRGDLSKLLVLAVTGSVLIEADAVCVFGIFVGSMLILPCTQVLGQLFPGLPFTLAKSHQYLWPALVISVGFVAKFRNFFFDNFEAHYLVPGIVLLSTLACGATATIFERARRRSQQ